MDWGVYSIVFFNFTVLAIIVENGYTFLSYVTEQDNAVRKITAKNSRTIVATVIISDNTSIFCAILGYSNK
ncbi:MAG: hypothetical protein IMZ43_05820 [Thermoplasmata archaeon]|nr:hypothetical protein [Thermoplasmata archaeon]